MEADLKSLLKLCLWVTAIQTYSYLLVSKLPPGKTRLIVLLPVFYLFTQLPLTFSTVHLRGISAFFLTWLSTFKLLLFSFDQGPLSLTLHPHLSLAAFISTASFPIKIKHHIQQKEQKKPTVTALRLLPLLGFAIKGLLLSLLVSLYRYRPRLHQGFVLTLYMCHMYLALDLVLAGSAALARGLAGAELEPQFNAPYLSTSLQDFWGRRWNLMVTRILRLTVYAPVRARCGPPAGVMATFLASGLMHEVMLYYLTLSGPTGELTCFFVLHGACTAAEIAAKRRLRGRWRLPAAVSVPLTLGFALATAFWLFFPPLLRNNTAEKVIAECQSVMGLVGTHAPRVPGLLVKYLLSKPNWQ